MRDRHDEIVAAGARVAAIGMGIPGMAADFRERQNVPFTLLVDHTKQTYRALDLARGSTWDVVGPSAWIRGIKGLASGHGLAKPQQDPFQLAGTAVVEPGGQIAYLHRARSSSDNASVDDVLKVLR